MFGEKNELFDFKLLPQNTSKLNSITVSSDSKSLFKETLSLLDFMFKELKSEFPIDITIDKTRLSIKGMPDTVKLSNLVYGISSNPSLVLDHLTNAYVGKEFFWTTRKVKSQAKEFAQAYFEEQKLTEKH